jgi:predicted RNase H-like HicB family nuclease
MDMKYPVVLEPSKDGGYAVHVPALPGCHTQGETVAEALSNAKDAIHAYLLSMRRMARERGKGRAKVYQVEVVV